MRLRLFLLAAPLMLAACADPAPPVPDLTGIWTLDANGRAGAALNGVGDFASTAPIGG